MFLFTSVLLTAQTIDIVPYLKQIENGEAGKVKSELSNLKKNNITSGELLFLEGVLTDDGEESLKLYKKVSDLFPGNKYADAALYRMFSYYYSIGKYDSSRVVLSKLRKSYPESPYIKVADREIPTRNELNYYPPAKTEQEVKQPPPSRYNKPTAEEKKDYKYTIQAGAFSNEANGKKLKQDFERSGFYSEIIDKNVGGTIFHVVMVGRFITEEEAKSFLQFINAEFKLEGRVVGIMKE